MQLSVLRFLKQEPVNVPQLIDFLLLLSSSWVQTWVHGQKGQRVNPRGLADIEIVNWIIIIIFLFTLHG